MLHTHNGSSSMCSRRPQTRSRAWAQEDRRLGEKHRLGQGTGAKRQHLLGWNLTHETESSPHFCSSMSLARAGSDCIPRPQPSLANLLVFPRSLPALSMIRLPLSGPSWMDAAERRGWDRPAPARANECRAALRALVRTAGPSRGAVPPAACLQGHAGGLPARCCLCAHASVRAHLQATARTRCWWLLVCRHRT